MRRLFYYGFTNQVADIENCFDLEKENNIRSTFFVYTGDRDLPFNPWYGLRDRISWDKKRVPFYVVLEQLRRKGFEIGLHGSTNAATDVGHLRSEVQRLKHHLKIELPFGVRHHRLKFAPPLTATLQRRVGLAYDSTVGFNRGPGFASGTAYPYSLYDGSNGAEEPFLELPITFQDYHLNESMHCHENGKNILEEFIERLREGNGGLFNVIWHPERFLSKKYGGYLSGRFFDLVSDSQDKYWYTTLSEVRKRWLERGKTLFYG
jgi:hypothetical protein